MTKKDLILRKIAISIDEMDNMWKEKADLAEALQYLLLLEDQVGVGAAFMPRSTTEINKAIADELGISTAKLAANRRKWTKDGVMAEARAFIAPLQLEQMQILADIVIANRNEIMMGFLKDALNPTLDTYARNAAWKVLKADVLAPALSNSNAPDAGDSDYLEKIKDIEESTDDEGDEYLRLNGGG